VADYLNPAGRLHELLTRFGAEPDLSVQDAWAEVLGVAKADVALYLGDVASLLRDVRDAAAETGNDAFAPMPQHLATLSRSVFPVDIRFNQVASNVAPDPTAMQMLKALSAYLEKTAPEGKIPEPVEVEELRASFGDLLDDVADAELPPEIRRALRHRLSDIITALDHLNVGGPDAVRRAAEALAISAVLYEQDAGGDSDLFTKLRSKAKNAWVAFTVVTTLTSAVLMFDQIIGADLLPPAPEQHQLPPGPPPGDHVDPPDPEVKPI
jgi:hypothetical protein